MKTAHRRAAHAKRDTMPKFWNRPLTSDQMTRCKLAHWTTIDQFTSGRATETELWDLVYNGFMYAELMRLLKEDGDEFTEEALTAIAEHLETFTSVIERFKRLGRVGFSAPELLAARAAAAEVMDQLIERDRFGFAVRAAEHANALMPTVRGAQ
ncbi:hypothetical protein [Hydrogenophaga sp.]|uniref:hypothetical protein n=1 Tax=Hydrogenophaga sp. TaxID=1904254 RepID=UPI002730F2B7|nr:hypothetical protein [Hydrogenophaga sp.]MDP2074603.1 hypothetical protein [Hydrogenophaga sp.]MDP3106428.1 hypothetical protein [Hydrogenophaga sp.]